LLNRKQVLLVDLEKAKKAEEEKRLQEEIRRKKEQVELLKRQEQQRKEKEKKMLEDKIKQDKEMLKIIDDQNKKKLAQLHDKNKAELAKKKAENNLKEQKQLESQQHQLVKTRLKLAQLILNQGSTLNDLQDESRNFRTQIIGHSNASGINLGELLMQAPNDVVNRIESATNRLDNRTMAGIAALPTPRSRKLLQRYHNN
jgi:chromosome segregation ATPase